MHFEFPDSILIIFCKAPIPGQVKTRLTPSLTPHQAVNVHVELTHRTLNTAITDPLCAIQLWCSPTTKHSFFKSIAASYPVSLHQQFGSDLGDRMHHAFSTTLKKFKHAILIGSDCPSLSPSDLRESLLALTKNVDVILAPAEDGGYVLVGLNKPHVKLFENIPWGSSEVLEKTRQRIAEMKLASHELNKHWDVDTAEDLKKYKNLF